MSQMTTQMDIKQLIVTCTSETYISCKLKSDVLKGSGI